jgi:hypothetical protein
MKNKGLIKALRITLQIVSNLRNIFILIILTRLLFLEDIPAAAFIEVLGGIILLATTPLQEECNDD